MTLRARQWSCLAGALLLGVLVAILVEGRHLEGRARALAIEMIEERFDRGVELASLDLQLFPWARASGKNLVVHQKPGHEDLPAFIAIERFEVDLDVLTLLLFRPVRFEAVRLTGLEIHIPPREDDDGGAEDSPENGDAVDGGQSAPQFTIDRVEAPETRLYIHPDAPGREPLLWDIQRLHIRSAGTTEPMRFDAVLENATPPRPDPVDGLVRSLEQR